MRGEKELEGKKAGRQEGKLNFVLQNLKTMHLCFYASMHLLIIFILFLTSVPAIADVISPELIRTSFPKVKVPSASSPIKTTTAPLPIDKLQGHFNNKIKIIFSDIDGTLIPFDKTATKWAAPQSVKQSAQKLKKAQIPFVLITGRAYPEVKELAKNMGSENTYIITLQGAEITNPQGKTIYKDYIKNKDFRKILKDVEVFNQLYNGHTSVYFIIDGQYYTFDKVKFPYMWQKLTRLKSFDELKPNVEPGKVEIYEPNPQKIKLMQAYFKKKFPEYHIDLGANFYCSITGSTATKGEAVKRLAKTLNIDLKNAATFGDAENDISMLKAVKNQGGLAVAVGNAMQNTKNNANFVTAPVTQDGFAKAVDLILINNKKLLVNKSISR